MYVEVNNRDNKFVRMRKREKKKMFYLHSHKWFCLRVYFLYIHVSGFPNVKKKGREESEVIGMTDSVSLPPIFIVKYDYSHAYMK